VQRHDGSSKVGPTGRQAPEVVRHPGKSVAVGRRRVLAGLAACDSSGGSSHILSVEGDPLDFGDVWEQEHFVWTLPVRNTSSEPLQILDIRFSCPACTSVYPKSLHIPVGQTAGVTIELNLSCPSCGAAEQPFRVSLVPLVEGHESDKVTWNITGRVRRLFDLSPGLLDFGDALVRGEPFPAKSLRVVCNAEVTEVAAKCDESLAKVEVALDRAHPAAWSISVTPSESLPVGDFRFHVVLEALSRSGKKLPPKRIPVIGCVVEDVVLVPSNVAIGAAKLGQVIEELVLLRSRGGRSLEVVAVDCEQSEGVVVTRKPDCVSKGEAFEVRQTVLESGTRVNHVRFRVRYGDTAEEIELPLTISYHGVFESQPGHDPAEVDAK